MQINLIDIIKTEKPLLTLSIAKNTIYFGGLSSIVYKYTPQDHHTNFLVFSDPIRAISTFNDFLICCSYKNAILMKNENYIDIIENIDTEIKGADIYNSKIGISTRGCEVWILEIKTNDTLEYTDYADLYQVDVSKIYKDHTHDVKGIKFNGKYIYTYGYDCAILIYDDELIERIECESTVWDIVFDEYIVVCDDLGHLYYFDYDYELVRKVRVCSYPIYKMCMVNDMIAIVYNRVFIAFIRRFEIVELLKCGDYAINCVDYCKESGLLGCVDDEGSLYVYRILF